MSLPTSSETSRKRKYNRISASDLQIPVITPYNYGENASSYSIGTESTVDRPALSSSASSGYSSSDRSYLTPFLKPASSDVPSGASSLSALQKPRRSYTRIPVLEVPNTVFPTHSSSSATLLPLQSPLILRNSLSKKETHSTSISTQPRLRQKKRSLFQKCDDVLADVQKDFGSLGTFLKILFWNRSKAELTDLRTIRHRRMIRNYLQGTQSEA